MQNVVQAPSHFLTILSKYMNGERVEKQCNLLHIHTLCGALLMLLNPRNIHTTVVDVYWSDLSCPQPLGLLRFFIRTTSSAVWGLRPTIAPWMFLLFQKTLSGGVANSLHLQIPCTHSRCPGHLEIEIKLRKNVGVQLLKGNHGDGGNGIKVAHNCRALQDWLALRTVVSESLGSWNIVQGVVWWRFKVVGAEEEAQKF